MEPGTQVNHDRFGTGVVVFPVPNMADHCSRVEFDEVTMPYPRTMIFRTVELEAY